MNDNPPPKKAIIAITENMAKAGLEVLTDYTEQTTEDGEGPSDVAMIVAIFTRMWQVHMAETEALRQGKLPKILMPKKPNGLLMPTPKGH